MLQPYEWADEFIFNIIPFVFSQSVTIWTIQAKFTKEEKLSSYSIDPPEENMIVDPPNFPLEILYIDKFHFDLIREGSLPEDFKYVPRKEGFSREKKSISSIIDLTSNTYPASSDEPFDLGDMGEKPVLDELPGEQSLEADF